MHALLTVFATLAAASAFGQSRTAIPLPGLESAPPATVLPVDCAVRLVADHVSVDLSVRTAVDSPALLLEGAFFGWSGSQAAYPDRQFPELNIRVDDAPGAVQDNFEAFMGGRNITQMLKLAGMDPWAITRSPPLTSAQPKAPQVLKGLSNIGAIELSGSEYLAKWQARRIMRRPLKAVAQQQVTLDYTVRPAISVATLAELDTSARERRYCLSPESLRRTLRTAGATTLLSVNEYIIPAGIDGKPPRSVTVTVSSGVGAAADPSMVFFLCGPHGKAIAKRNTLNREHADVDDSGNLHLLGVAESTEPPAT